MRIPLAFYSFPYSLRSYFFVLSVLSLAAFLLCGSFKIYHSKKPHGKLGSTNFSHIAVMADNILFRGSGLACWDDIVKLKKDYQ